MLNSWEKDSINRTLVQAKKELDTANYLSECSNNPGIRKIYGNRSDMLSTLIYYTKQHLEEHA